MCILRLMAIAGCVVCGAARDAGAQLKTIPYASGFSRPIAFVQDPADRTIQFVVEQGGRVRAVRNGTVLATDFLDLTSAVSSGGERGLLGLTFAPDHATSRRFFVNFTNTAGHTVVARFRRSSSNPLVADSSTRFDLRWGGAGGPAVIVQPYTNHKGGNLAFGPDGFLYIGLGDGGSGNDPEHRAQNPAELLGKMLRIDVNVPDSHPTGYQVPADNPFVGGVPVAARPEIWSFGLRNPWKYSFDDPARGGTGALIMGDVGQGVYEEIDYEPRNRGGRNYGWRNREGAHNNVTSRPPAYLPLVDPIYEYDHAVGQSITGGYVYRGRALGPGFQGRYFFADFIQGRVWSIALTIDPVTMEAVASPAVEHTARLGGSSQLGNISAFGLDADAELYIVNYSSGAVLQVLDARAHNSDFDGDVGDDVSVYRPTTGVWFTLYSGSRYTTYTDTPWGAAGDTPVPGDYDGDRKADIAVYRPSTGTWFVLPSTTNNPMLVTWGVSTDIPVPGDYDGDTKADFAVYRPSTGVWWVLLSSTNYSEFVRHTLGASTDVAVPGDYDGDGKWDVAVHTPATGVWSILESSANDGTPVTHAWGVSTDITVPGDYDGDGKNDLAVYRPSEGNWHVLKSSTGYTTFQITPWGTGADIPAPGDYDADLKTDLVVYRASTGTWYLLTSRSNYTAYLTLSWGASIDIPVLKRP